MRMDHPFGSHQIWNIDESDSGLTTLWRQILPDNIESTIRVLPTRGMKSGELCIGYVLTLGDTSYTFFQSYPTNQVQCSK